MPNKVKSTKKIKQRLHSKRRAVERYGLVFTTKDLKEMVKLIEERPLRYARRLATTSLRASVWLVTYKGIDSPVVYDRKRSNIVTILPLEVIEKYRPHDPSERMAPEVKEEFIFFQKLIADNTVECPQCKKIFGYGRGTASHWKAKHAIFLGKTQSETEG